MFTPNAQDKYRVRRRFAIVSFVMLILITIGIFGLSYFDKSIESHTGILTTLILGFTGIITGFFTVTHLGDNKNGS